MHLWFAEYLERGATVLLLSHIFWILLSITLHELAHGWAALWQGDDTPRRLNRMTMNPLVHMGWMSLLMFAIIGIAWGVMPVDPSRFRWKRRGRIVVAGAGPAMNIALAIIALTGASLWIVFGSQAQPLHDNVLAFLTIGGVLNIVLAMLNLLPVPPLDGADVLMGFSFRFYRLFQRPQAQMIGMFILLAIFISGAGGLLFVAAYRIANRYMNVVVALLT